MDAPVYRPSLKERLRVALSRVDTALPRFERPALVAGSAPNLVVPEGFDAGWAVVTANAAQAILEPFGIELPDLTVWRGHLFAESELNADARARLQGRRTRCLLVDARLRGRQDEFTRNIRELRFAADRIVFCDRYHRARVYKEVISGYCGLGRALDRPSNGLYATVLALRLGASPVVISGISLSQGGHAYRERDIPRLHAEQDEAALRALAGLGRPVFTTDPEVSARTGVPLWPTAARASPREDAIR